MNQVCSVMILGFVGLVLTAQTSYATMYSTIYTLHGTAPPASKGYFAGVQQFCEKRANHLWNVTRNYTISDDARSECTAKINNATANKYPNEWSYQQGLEGGLDNFNNCDTADSWSWGSNCSLAMTPEKGTCNTNSSADVWTSRIHNTTACLDGYRDGWKHWCKDNATASECNDLAKQGIIPDFIRNNTLVDLQTNINQSSDNSNGPSPPGTSEEIIHFNLNNATAPSIIRNSTGTYKGPAVIIHHPTDNETYANSTGNSTD
jgi:hypothetical protein